MFVLTISDTNDRGSGGHGHHHHAGSGAGGGGQNDGSGSGQDDEHGSGYGWGDNGNDISFHGGSPTWRPPVVNRQPPKNRPRGDNSQTNNNGYQSATGGSGAGHPRQASYHRISLPWIVSIFALLLVKFSHTLC